MTKITFFNLWNF